MWLMSTYVIYYKFYDWKVIVVGGVGQLTNPSVLVLFQLLLK